MKLGIYRIEEVLDAADIASIESKCDMPIEVVSVFRAWNTCRIEDDLIWLERLKGSCRDIMLTWEPWQLFEINAHPEQQPQFSLEQILSGRYDAYIISFVQILSEFPQTIYLRPMHEMNGNWYPWGGCVNNNSADLFVQVWHYLRKLAENSLPSNIQWVWSPYAASYPCQSANAIDLYFPGDAAVDWVAIDGYNWGETRPEIGWKSFEATFQDAYQIITTISNRPMIIAETGCCESGGDKAEWIETAFKSIANLFDRIEILIWFDVDKECDWRMASSPHSLNAFRRAVKWLKCDDCGHP